MKIFIILVLLLGTLVAFGTALPFFSNDIKAFQPAQAIFDDEGIVAPAEMGVGKVYVSSSASDYDSTPSDGGGDTNPTPPTDPPGGRPTVSGAGPVLISSATAGGVTAGVILGLALVVGIAVAVAVYIIKKKG